MSASTPATPRLVRLCVIALMTASLLAPMPRLGRADPLPSGGARSADLPALVASLHLFDEAAPAPDGYALRRAVTPYAVRLAADPRATHPLDGRLAVRDTHLGSPGQVLRRVALALPAPESFQATPAAPAPRAMATAAPTPTPVAAARPQAKPVVTAATAPQAKPVAKAAAAPQTKPAAPSGAATPAKPATLAAAASRPAATVSPAVKIVPPPARSAPTAGAAAPQAGHRIAGSPGPGRSVLVAGDSLSIDLAAALRPLLAGRPGTSYAAKGKISSGLARPDFFDWERTMRELSLAHRPDTVLVMIATNDNQTLTRPDGSKVAFGRPGWDAEYARRVRRLVELARLGNPGARIYWIGAPVMANPRLNADVAAINAVIRRQVQALPGCRFVDVWPTLADATGHFTPYKLAQGTRRATRTPDGVHLTGYGARLLADACLASLSPTVAALEKP